MKIPKKISTATLLTCVMITPIANGLVYTHAQTVINNGDHSNQIAIVNEDKGVVNAKGETVRYSDQFLPSYNKDGYIVTSLDKARNSGYLAYVVVPSNFSSNVESINTQPTQSVLGYYIEDETHANEAVMKIVQLEMNLNRDIGKLYVGSILNEFYQAQDNAEIVLNNSNINSQAISQLANTDFIRTIDLKPLELPKAPDGTGLAKDKESYFGPFTDAISQIRGTYQSEVVDPFEQAKVDATSAFNSLDETMNQTNAAKDEMKSFKDIQIIKFNDFTFYASENVKIDPYQNGYKFSMKDKTKVLTNKEFQVYDQYDMPIEEGNKKYDLYNKPSVTIIWNGKDIEKVDSVNSGRNRDNVISNNAKEKINEYLESDNGIKESNNHILLQNSINYLDLLYFDVINEFVTDIITDPSLATQSHFNQLMQIRFNKYGNNINVAINQFNQYSDIKINSIQDYINLRTGQYQKIAANYDFTNHNLDAVSTTIKSMFDTAENTYNSANDSVDTQSIDSHDSITTSSTKKGIGENYKSWFSDMQKYIDQLDPKLEEYKREVNKMEEKVDPNVILDVGELDINSLEKSFLPVNQFVQALKENNGDVLSIAGKVNSENAKAISDYQTQTNKDLQARVESLENVNNATSANNKNLIGDFSTKLRYSRSGNVPNKTVVDTMMAPLSVTNDGDVKGSVTVPTVNKQDEEEIQKYNVNPWVIGLGISTAVLASYIVGDALFSRKKHK